MSTRTFAEVCQRIAELDKKFCLYGHVHINWPPGLGNAEHLPECTGYPSVTLDTLAQFAPFDKAMSSIFAEGPLKGQPSVIVSYHSIRGYIAADGPTLLESWARSYLAKLELEAADATK